jgi:hypothetical protein
MLAQAESEVCALGQVRSGVALSEEIREFAEPGTDALSNGKHSLESHLTAGSEESFKPKPQNLEET